jgi:hypothetical protein
MTAQARTVAFATAAILAVLLLGAGVLIGRGSVSSAQRSSTTNPIALVNGVPVGVADTPAGAIAANDNYLATEAQTDEQDPTVFATLVATVFTPATGQLSLQEAAQLRSSDTTLTSAYAAGARALAVVGARRLDSYSRQRATLTTWVGAFLWGPTLAPEQTWNLINSTLVWRDGRWLLAQLHIDTTAAPVPSIVYVDGDNNTAAAFNALNGMTAPFYGTAG